MTSANGARPDAGWPHDRPLKGLGPAEGSSEAPLSAVVKLQREGKIGHIGLSNVIPKQVQEARAMTEVACVQNLYDPTHRQDDALIDELAAAGIAYLPLFPFGGLLAASVFDPLRGRAQLGATPMQVALAWLLRRAPNVLLVAGTSSIGHRREDFAAADLELSDDTMKALDSM